MVMILSYIIAVVITIFLAVFLYPISAFFYVIGKIGYVLGILADYIFEHTNSGIKKLWEDIRKTRVVRYDENTESEITTTENQ